MFERFRGTPTKEPEGDPKLVMHETVDLDDGPIDIALSSHSLRIVEPKRDIKDAWNVDCLVIDPLTYSTRKEIGYKGLRDGETIILGRQNNYGRFNFPQTVSREHVSISREGSRVTIEDLGSHNGTYIFAPAQDPHKPSVTRPVDETIQDGSIQPDAHPTDENRPQANLESLEFKMAGSSIPSDRHPSRNEDTFLVDKESLTVGVFDGVGGSPGSERAATLAAESVRAHLKGVPLKLPRSLSHTAMNEALMKGHRAIIEGSPNPIATTAVVAKIFETESGSPYAVVASAGDSRAYLFRGNRLDQLTLDHAYRMPGYSDDQERVLQETLASATDLSQLDEEALVAFKMRNILTSHLGGADSSEVPVITVEDFEVHEGDRLVVTSDGVHDNLTTSEIEAILQDHESVEVAMEALVHAARLRSQDESHARAKPDDMTASVISF